MLTTPETIRTLQRKLYRKAKQEPACRFHALYDKVYRADILEFAYRLVRANKGSAGIDGVTFEVIEENEGAPAFIGELEETLRNKTYKPEVRGWVGYFYYRNSSATLKKMKNHLEQRLVTHLRKRHKVRDRKTGHVRFSTKSLYDRYGLYKVPTTAAWMRAHAL
ncbi:MAG: group II intron maturase-specific domain-containing protein [Desulfuromonadaceae bacterium]|nr:group II intron maturase-specific domain-containing protein [Desulfuromonadaceae bacterium]